MFGGTQSRRAGWAAGAHRRGVGRIDEAGCDLNALAGLQIVEINDQFTAIGGRVLAELGADVVVVEPPGGSPDRLRPPFADDNPSPNTSLRWWSGNVGKRSVTVDLDTPRGVAALRRLIAGADIVISGTALVAEGVLAYQDLAAVHPALIWLSVSPFGLDSVRGDHPVTDLTMLAGGGPVWNCGYDDHSLPPIRGAGDQSANIAGLYCAIGALVALAHRDQTGQGQLVDVSVNAACNVSSEQVTYHWLVNNETCVRQTSRHAYFTPSLKTQVQCADGAYATTGVLPRKPREYTELLCWLTDLGLRDELPEAVFLEMAAARDALVDLALIGVDDETTAILTAAREAISLIASRLPAKEYFLQSQRRGFAAGAVLSPDEAIEDEHVAARGFRVQVSHPELGRTFTYPGTPYLFNTAPSAAPPRPPLPGEHNYLLDE
ncbi:CoA transferase [Mycobacterium vicinigordonae]|uniref:CoA transferase n=1 Tax=Mycobacterium vicinigordonae TaxID=1719132 RepID=A0A7D6E0G8_9MYCO|nr:CoA transferase [Mycobacterium vicinigordonae]QLL08908.1 CoA transferase [Mycobacterium vicinigordonae]